MSGRYCTALWSRRGPSIWPRQEGRGRCNCKLMETAIHNLPEKHCRARASWSVSIAPCVVIQYELLTTVLRIAFAFVLRSCYCTVLFGFLRLYTALWIPAGALTRVESVSSLCFMVSKDCTIVRNTIARVVLFCSC